ncbi:hypothetical protein HU200_030387 [Digitaria exilis]|uniref:Uncharacterized protein n=1 Tax=Digitaria exilis TaxID=1010633 RepID=A0A835BRQ2_9POAL|nr:hypothetical protein HU200_030387 [Digitaria exilis]
MAGSDMNNERELVAARSLRSLRRLVRMATIKEAAALEQSEILRLKREADALMKRTPEEEAEIQRLTRKHKRESDAFMNRTTSTEEEPQPQPAAGNKRRKVIIKKTLVPRAAIEYMILNPHNPLRGFREEKLAIYSQELREELSELYYKRKAIAENMLEQERALIRQFRKKGHAEDYTEVEVTDDEDN